MAKILSDGKIQVEQGDTLSGIYGADWKKLSGYTGDPTKLQIGTVLPAKTVQTATPTSGAGATPSSSGLLDKAVLGDYLTPEEQQAKAVAEKALLSSGNATKDTEGNIVLGDAPDEAKNRAAVLAEFQKQIDALETAKAEARSKLTTQYTDIGNRRVGAQRALLAGSGMIGQVSGEAEKAVLEKANVNELNAAVDESDAKYNAAIQTLYTTINQEADKSYTEKKTAYSGTADQLVSYLNSKSTSKTNSINNVVKQAIALGIDLTADNASDVIAKAVSDIGVSKENILSAYKTAKKSAEEASAKAKQESDKAAMDLLKTQTDIAKTKAETSKLYQDAADVGTVKSGVLKVSYSDIASLQNYFNSSRGNDGYTGSKEYMQSYNDWITNGGISADFIKYYPPKIYLNPNDTSNLPTWMTDGLKTPDILSQLNLNNPVK